MNDVDKFVAAIVEQDSLAGSNPILSEDDIQQMQLMGSVNDVQMYAIEKGIDAGKVNNALISTGLDTSSDPMADLTSLFGFGEAEKSILGGLPSDYSPRNAGETDFYREGDEYNIFANLPTEDLYNLQARLIQGGLLARGAFTPGDFDTSTAGAIRLVLSRELVLNQEKNLLLGMNHYCYIRMNHYQVDKKFLFIYHQTMQKYQQE